MGVMERRDSDNRREDAGSAAYPLVLGRNEGRDGSTGRKISQGAQPQVVGLGSMHDRGRRMPNGQRDYSIDFKRVVRLPVAARLFQFGLRPMPFQCPNRCLVARRLSIEKSWATGSK